MDKERVASDNDGLLKGGDGIEKLQQIAQQAIAESYQDGDKLYIAIPVEDDMTYWGTGIWHFTEEGRMVRANDLFSEMLSTAIDRNVRVGGFTQRRDETGNTNSVIMAIVSD
ncbi:MAG TPA: hypothetical protein VGF75_03725 [Candidatus Saccharimonadales bacterium]